MVYVYNKHYLILAWIPVGWQSVCVAVDLYNLSP